MRPRVEGIELETSALRRREGARQSEAALSCAFALYASLFENLMALE